jgi:hypothetical protein
MFPSTPASTSTFAFVDASKPPTVLLRCARLALSRAASASVCLSRDQGSTKMMTEPLAAGVGSSAMARGRGRDDVAEIVVGSCARCWVRLWEEGGCNRAPPSSGLPTVAAGEKVRLEGAACGVSTSFLPSFRLRPFFVVRAVVVVAIGHPLAAAFPPYQRARMSDSKAWCRTSRPLHPQYFLPHPFSPPPGPPPHHASAPHHVPRRWPPLHLDLRLKAKERRT